ncbi:MAG: glycosyltransferase family 4 protein [Clostridia bacterium]|nr:glycosyltransferase family 4 protein [Clostridia bacterium]
MNNKTINNIMLLTLGYSPEISGGVATHVQELAHALKNEGKKVTVLAHSPGETKVVNDDGVWVHYVSASSQTLSKNSTWSQGILGFNDDLYAYAANLILKDQPDIIHYHHWYTYKAACKLKETFSIPTIGTIHYLTYPIESWWGQEPDKEIGDNEREWLTSTETFISVSQSMAKVIEDYYPGTREKTTVIRTSISMDKFLPKRLSEEKKTALRQKLAGKDKKIILFAGRINRQKGIVPLLDSAALVIKKFPNVQYIIAGQSDSRDYYKMVTTHMEGYPGLKERCTFLGHVKREQLTLLYQAADISVFPSIYEPLGLVAVEAMAAGSPPIVTGGGGLEESVQHEKTGLVVPVNPDEVTGLFKVDINKLADAQLTLLFDDKKREEFSEAGRKYVAEEHNFAKSTLYPTLQIYEKTAENFLVKGDPNE